jgi:DNA-binding transcriptional LysR family regulator
LLSPLICYQKLNSSVNANTLLDKYQISHYIVDYLETIEDFMVNPQHLAVFAAIIRAGSISRAAGQLGCGKSVISRQLTKLEETLGARLVQRSTRRLALTEIGELVLQEALQISQSLTNIEQLTDQFQQEVRGILRISCAKGGRRLLVPLITQFIFLHPKIQVDLRLDDQLVDLIADKIDVAIRASHLSDSSLIARKLSDNPYIIVAAPTYLARAGKPENPAELSKHACVLYTSGDQVRDEWIFSESNKEYKVRVKGIIQINDADAMIAAGVAGAGILKIPQHLITQELLRGELVPVLPQYVLPPGPPVYAVYPARNFLALKTSAFVQFIQEKMA